ncbi:unnamed protein product, partial [Phaeothamnion confervicola]
MGVLATGCVVSAIKTYVSFVRGPPPTRVDMAGKVVIVTGANAGIGYETAK